MDFDKKQGEKSTKQFMERFDEYMHIYEETGDLKKAAEYLYGEENDKPKN